VESWSETIPGRWSGGSSGETLDRNVLGCRVNGDSRYQKLASTWRRPECWIQPVEKP
jgi:hypothetical protein